MGMNHLARILCAVDSSVPAQAAFGRALALARERGASLTVVHAVPAQRSFGWNAGKRLAGIAALRRAAANAGVRLRVRVQHGDPAGVIALHAAANEYDLVVLGTHQRTSGDRFREGSVAERVVSRGGCATLIVPMSRDDGEASTDAASFGNIVAATDFEAASDGAVAAAHALATAGGARLTLVHVIRRISPRFVYQFAVPEYARLAADNAWQRLQEAIPVGEREADSLRGRILSGAPTTEILRVSGEMNADLIVVGVSTRGTLTRKLFGATFARIAREAPCAVLAVPEQSAPRRRHGTVVAARAA
jgi:nucleotide-binding universal stress UspA family protein